jgi:NarL family two-component system response regulator LiaR
MDTQRPIRVMIVDDHLLMRDGLRLLLGTYADLAVVALAASGEDAVAQCATARPDVVLMDLMMPGLDGPAATRQIKAAFPAIQVIALTSHLEEALVQRAVQAGAIGYQLKNTSAERLTEAIRGARAGRTAIDTAAVPLLVRAVHQPQRLGHDLSERERQALAQLASGKTNREIAHSLALSPGTVKIYVSNVLAKLRVSNRTEATVVALQHHLVPGEPAAGGPA